MRNSKHGNTFAALSTSAIRGAAAGLAVGCLAVYAFTILYLQRRQYVPSEIPYAAPHLLLLPLGKAVPPLIAAGLVIGGLLGLGRRVRRVLIAFFLAAGAAAVGIGVHAKLFVLWPRRIPYVPGVVAAAALAGVLGYLAAPILVRLARAIPLRWVAPVVALPAALVLLFAGFAHPSERLIASKRLGDREFLELFDRSAEGMEEIFARSDRGDLPGALEALAAHFRTRPVPPHVLDPQPADSVEMARAEKAMAHLYGMTGFEHQEGPSIDWTGSAVRDREYAYTINRHFPWVDLARAYRLTGDDRYVREIVSLLEDWTERTDPVRWKSEGTTTHWRLLECALRLRGSWIPVAAALHGHPDLDARFWRAYLGSVHDQAQFIAMFRSEANHLLMESNGLLETGIFFPEFARSRRWIRIAEARLAQQTRVQVYPDGAHMELSPAYHRLVLEEFMRANRIAKASGIQQSPELIERIQAMWSYSGDIIRPDGWISNLNDGAAVRIADELRSAALDLQRNDLLYAATAGREGTAPDHLSRLYPQAGQAVMRTGFRAEDLYLVFDGGAFGGPHGHEDKLSVVCSAYGRAMLVDPGSFTYDGSHPFRKYFVSSFGHNTVVVDGLSQARGRQAASYRFKPGPSPLWEKGELGEYVEARYDEGYADFRRWRDPADRSVVHTRGVLFVKPDYWVVLDRLEGKGSHRLTRLFHLAPGEARTVPGGAAGADSGMANLFLLAPEPDVVVSVVKGSEDPIQGWYSSGYNAKEPAPAILFEGTSNLPASLVTALIPARPGESAHATVDRIDLPGGGVLVIVTGGGDEAGEDLIVWPGPRSPAGSAGGLAWAAGLRVGLARIDAAGNARIWKVGEGDLRAGGPGRAVTSPSKGEGAGR